MKFLSSIVLLIFCFRISSTFVIGKYYMINKGFSPSQMKEGEGGDVISYKAFLSKGKPREKRICGYWHIHRRIENLGLNITMDIYTKNSGAVNSGSKIVIENLCKSKFPMEPFLDRFNGTLDETCSLDPGLYTLWNWSFEDHIKKVIPTMVLGEYVVHLCWIVKNTECVLKNDIIMEFRDEKEIEAENTAGNIKEAKKERKAKDKKEKKGKKEIFDF